MEYDEAREKYALDKVQGWMDLCDMIWLFERAKTIKNGRIVEIGCWKGKSTGAILSGFDISNDIFCVDPWCEEITQDEHYRGSDSAFNLFKEHTSRFDIKPNIIRNISSIAVEEFEDSSLDWVFIDGDHSTSAVLEDLKLWSKKIKRGGILSGHDWQFDTVKKAIDQFGLKIDGITTHPDKNGNLTGSIWWSEC